MNSMICLFACVAFASAQVLLHDDGQWKPHLDGSVLGQWNPLVDNSLAGQPLLTRAAVLGHPLVHLLKKRAAVLATPWAAHGVVAAHGLVNPNALNVPLDTVHVAAAKNAQLVSQATEGTRNVLGGGVPVYLPADTPEVAAGKAAHAVAHETQKALTAGVWAGHGLVAGHGVVADQGVVAARTLLAGHGLVAPHGVVAGHGLVAPHGVVAGHGLVAPHGVVAARSWLW